MTGKLLEITHTEYFSLSLSLSLSSPPGTAQVIPGTPRVQDVTIFPGVFVSVCETLAQADQI